MLCILSGDATQSTGSTASKTAPRLAVRISRRVTSITGTLFDQSQCHTGCGRRFGRQSGVIKAPMRRLLRDTTLTTLTHRFASTALSSPFPKCRNFLASRSRASTKDQIRLSKASAASAFGPPMPAEACSAPFKVGYRFACQIGDQTKLIISRHHL